MSQCTGCRHRKVHHWAWTVPRTHRFHRRAPRMDRPLVPHNHRPIGSLDVSLRRHQSLGRYRFDERVVCLALTDIYDDVLTKQGIGP